jgi:hypothetical protein
MYMPQSFLALWPRLKIKRLLKACSNEANIVQHEANMLHDVDVE